MLTLGIWDGHDAGAAFVECTASGQGQVLFAINEERLSRRKLDIGFPTRSIAEGFRFLGLKPDDIAQVSVSTRDFAKTLTRLFPKLREEYYLLRRKKKEPKPLNRLKKLVKYKLTELPPLPGSEALGHYILTSELRRVGFRSIPLAFVDHHRAHAISAALCSGISEALVLTIDGIGDGLSGSIWSWRSGQLTPLQMLSGKHSLGIFFEHVTNLLNMRELEDEGKVMALANFASPVPDVENPLLSFFSVEGMTIRSRYPSIRLYRELARVLWRYPSEQFAYMAQRVLEVKIVQLVRNALSETKHSALCYAGGVASNVKVNMLLSELSGVKQLYVFPHMGDGGLALGAALDWLHQHKNLATCPLPHLFLGPSYNETEIKEALQDWAGITVRREDDIIERAASLIAQGQIIFWFHGRMELGPRALGARSILALPDSVDLKEDLNLRLKKRVWYQPFCPSMLEEDAQEVLENYQSPANKFMTCAYRTKREKRSLVAGIINVDGTCRPQILPTADEMPFTKLIRRLKEKRGSGIILNTSFNLHGEPLVCSPRDALKTFLNTDIDYLVLDQFLVSKKSC